ncbi:MAG TPA: carboxypeptidase-like regulatory domain-containing protein, partial [Terriglobales bacterium]|nr:carboxypeptidase-like regulatory domain-containing protein [Terriglobales bacterium]
MPRVRLLSVLLLLLVAVLCPAQSEPPDEPKFNVTGTVVNALTGEPIKRALVEVYAQQPRAIMTDGDGHFQFEGVLRGSYSIQARKPGFFSESEITRGRHNNPVLLNDGKQSVTVKLYPEATISGTILDRDGLPVPQMMVRVLSRQIEAGRARWVAVQQKSTDDDGAYRIPGLMPGTYAIVAGPYSFPAPLLENGKGRPEGFRETFYPSGNDLSSAQKFQVKSGQKFEANFSLSPEPLYKVHGTYSGDASSVNVSLMAASLGISGSNIPTSMLEGNQFESEWTPPGNYRLVANGNDSTGHAAAANVPLIVHQDVLNAHIALQPLVNIPIEVEQHQVSTRKAQSHIGIDTRTQPGYLQIRAKDPWLYGTLMSGAIAPNSVLPNVNPGRYDIQIMMSSPWFAESVTRGDADLLTEDLVVTPGGEQQPVRIIARDDSATIKARLDAPPNTTATLLIVPTGRDPSQVRELPIAARGESYLPPQAPGDYTFLALDDASDLEYTN